jgi:hypothetical protein
MEKPRLRPRTLTTRQPPTIDQFKPEDLETMRQAFIAACRENPDFTGTEEPRYDLADAMVRSFRKHITKQKLIAATLKKIRKQSSM